MQVLTTARPRVSPQVRFVLDSETRDPTDVAMYNLKEANSMVEEFMLLANITVARQIAQAFPQHAILRRHPPPPPGAFDGLNHALRAHGFELDASSSFALSDSLDACTKPADPYFNKLVRILATRSMQQARYFSSGTLTPADYLHYGLAAPIYTHFTSPIRRYAALPSTSATQHARAHHGAPLPSPQVRPAPQYLGNSACMCSPRRPTPFPTGTPRYPVCRATASPCA